MPATTSLSDWKSAPRRFVSSSGEPLGDGSHRILGVARRHRAACAKAKSSILKRRGKCIREALVDAEEKSDVMIGSVYLGHHGGPHRVFNNRGARGDSRRTSDEICEEDFEDVQASAREVSIPRRTCSCTRFSSTTTSMGRMACLDPIGPLGQQARGGFPHHPRHWLADEKRGALREGNRPLRCSDVVFNPLASRASRCSIQHQKESRCAGRSISAAGPRIIWSMSDGAVRQSGEPGGIGGDHITNDISHGSANPDGASAEQLKIEEGNVTLGNRASG